MKKLLVTVMFLFLLHLTAREDCVGIHYTDVHGVMRNNPNKDLTFTGYAQCLCGCTGEWTQGGMCKMCGHFKKPTSSSKRATQNQG